MFSWYRSHISWVTANKWDKVFKSGPNNICGRQPLKNLKGYGLLNFTWSALEYQNSHVRNSRSEIFLKNMLSKIILNFQEKEFDNCDQCCFPENILNFFRSRMFYLKSERETLDISQGVISQRALVHKKKNDKYFSSQNAYFVKKYASFKFTSFIPLLSLNKLGEKQRMTIILGNFANKR